MAHASVTRVTNWMQPRNIACQYVRLDVDAMKYVMLPIRVSVTKAMPSHCFQIVPILAASPYVYPNVVLAIVWVPIGVNVMPATSKGPTVRCVKAIVICKLIFYNPKRKKEILIAIHCLFRRCENGFCANRTGCICHDGYKYDFNTTSCLPECGDTCENGICIAPGNCRCFNGYQRNREKCEAICEQ